MTQNETELLERLNHKIERVLEQNQELKLDVAGVKIKVDAIERAQDKIFEEHISPLSIKVDEVKESQAANKAKIDSLEVQVGVNTVALKGMELSKAKVAGIWLTLTAFASLLAGSLSWIISHLTGS